MQWRPPRRACATCGSRRSSARTSRSRTARSSSTASGWRSRSSTNGASRAVDQFVFGYGSLVEALDARGRAAHLRGYRRVWRVAMDNTKDLPGYKYYVDADTKERPAVYVAFVDIEPADGDANVEGVVFPVSDERLAQLDARERNYRRIEVAVDPPTGATTYAYVGTPGARARLDAGRRAGTVCVARAYLEIVAGSSTTLPVRDLERVDLP